MQVIDSLDRLKKNFRGEGGDGEIHSTTAACIERLEQVALHICTYMLYVYMLCIYSIEHA